MMNLNLLLLSLLLMTITTAHAQTALPPCPTSPNCVSSQALATDAQHFIAPFKLTVAGDKAWLALEQALLQQSRTVITAKTSNSLHAEATSLIFRFVDDIDVVLDTQAQLLHIRSASRTGHSDFGVNRKRVEALRLALQKAQVIE